MKTLSELAGVINATGVITGPQGATGATGATGAQGPAGESAPVYYGTGDPPDPSGYDNGSIYFKYTA